MFLISLHVWLTFGTDRELQNIAEIGKIPPEKSVIPFEFAYLQRGGGVQLTDMSPAIRCLWSGPTPKFK